MPLIFARRGGTTTAAILISTAFIITVAIQVLQVGNKEFSGVLGLAGGLTLGIH